MTTYFSILPFPQTFDGDRLHLNMLVVPRLSTAWSGNPLLPIDNVPNAGDTAPAFADADLRLEVRVIDGFGTFPVNTPVDFTADLPDADGVRPDARQLFEALVAPGTGRFTITGAPRLAGEVKPGIFIQKYLPRTYREAFLFNGPRTADARTDDAYHCAVKEKKPLNPAFVPSGDDVSWGEVYAFCLRHASSHVSLAWYARVRFLYRLAFWKRVASSTSICPPPETTPHR